MRFVEYIAILILSFFIGTTAGEILALVIPERFWAAGILAKTISLGFEPCNFNLQVMNITIGINILINIFSWIGLFISATALFIKEVSGK